MRSLSIGATGMLAQQLNVEVISNNIANLTTSGFKRQRAEFQDLLYQNYRRVGSTSSDAGTIVPSGIQIGAGVKTSAVYRIHEQGNLSVTDNSLDLAINGQGFFQIEMPDGTTSYTRSGSFQLSPEGTIVTSDGYPLVPGIVVPADAVTITINGEGSVLINDDAAPVGQIQLANFPNEAGLESMGGSLLRVTPASGEAAVANPGAAGFGRLIQGSVEMSNVNIVQEITSLITAQRAYEMNSKVISTSDQMMNSVSQMR
ncbi:flagellar basal-body rod protein FlgG [Arenibaculum pallidiluteum]|uniref:flagellar basal-body rod protein FlgG n=1 Tax=Arenibaculum pallidiluteum TaxID=2812559 RepID=UPI001A96AA92|nr:flagellar basal-body rod protein FlgG [Arenibaculum pallidiluteum]